MKKTSDTTFAYIARNFFFLLPIVVLPVTLLVIFQRDTGAFDLLANMARGIESGGGIRYKDFFADLYSRLSLINFDTFKNAAISKSWFWILTALVVAVFFSIAVSSIERHMRLGVRSPWKWFGMFKSSALNVIPYLLLMVAFYEVCMLVLSGFIMLNASLFNGWWAFAVSALATFVIYAAFLIGFCFMLLTVPSMVCDGYRFGFAASYSIHLVSEHFKRFVGVFILTTVVSSLVLYVLKLGMILLQYNIPFKVVFYILKTLNYIWWLMFVPTYAIRNYMDYTEATRRDLQTKLFG